MGKIDIKNLSRKELEEILSGLGVEKYRTRQIFRWLYKLGARSFDEMNNLSVKLRERLKAKFCVTHIVVSDSKSSSSDGTTKYLFRLEDGNTIESVFLPEAGRSTICLSSQVGCRFSCGFCASAKFGFVRNLESSEILDQVLFIRSKESLSHIRNIVFMGIGEPLDNYDNVMKAVRILNDREGFGIAARKITISTCGIIPGIKRLEGERLQVELSVSLHSADDVVRSRLVPINKVYPLKDLIMVCRDYVSKTNRVITFEYVLIKSLNSSRDDALKLAMLLRGLKCKVNAISYNLTGCKGYEGPDIKDERQFIETLKSKGINALLRKPRGEDIDAGCGQLRISRM